MGYQKAQVIARLAETTRIVTVADREGDLSDLYHEAYTSTQSTSAYWLIRAIRNRRLLDAKGNFQRLKMIEMVKNTQPVGTIEFELPASTHSWQRQVQQAIYAAQVRLNPPDRKRKKTSYEIVEAYVVIATELNPPTNQAPIEWVLLTHVDFNDQVTPYVIVQWYLCRWQIEVYFRILKSGCQVEKLQLETGKRFATCLTLYMIIAWQILYLTHLAREYPEMPCHPLFSDEECTVAYMMSYQKKCFKNQ